VDIASTKDTAGVADLVSRIRAGDRQAEEELVQRYSRGARIIIDQIVRNPTDAEDLVQETLMIALEKIRRGDLREPEKVPGFVCGIAKNLAQRYSQKTLRRNFTNIDEVPPPVDPNHSPLKQLLQKENAEIVRQVIGELRMERDRQVLTRFYILEEDKESICAGLGLTSTYFNGVIFRAHARFKELYEEKLSSKNPPKQPRRGK
jgi:RNA polymerase sigma-70 factor, ECF subfamily